MTLSPGTAVWERFGHNAIWVHDPGTGTDIAYNYGMFSFRQENFFLNFARGRMRYWMAGFDAGATVRQYARAGRTVWAQELALTPDERLALRDALRRNDTDDARFYRYDYYLDNCSSRVRDAVDAVIGGALRARFDTVQTAESFRSYTRAMARPDLPVFVGLDLLLGPSADRRISAWEEMFLPLALRARLAQMTRRLPDGREVPLVQRELTLASGALPVEPPPDAGNGFVPLGVAGLLIAGLVLLGGGRSVATGGTRWQLWPARLWALIGGLGGLVLWGLWLATDHVVARGNANVLLLSVASLPLVGLLPRPGRAGLACAGVLAAGVVLAGLLAAAPGGQGMGPGLVLLAPPQLALAWVVRRRAVGYP
jgi:hypothetical protein